MLLQRTRRHLSALFALAALLSAVLIACGTIQGLDDYVEVDCLGDACDAATGEDVTSDAQQLGDVANVDMDVNVNVDADANTSSDAITDATSDGPITTIEERTIGGNVYGLVGSGLELQNNSAEKLTIATSGPFKFLTPLAPDTSYAVAITAQPTNPSQNCAVSGGSGVVGTADITTVIVNCDPDKHTVGGTVSGLASDSVFLKNNGADIIEVGLSGPFTFPTPLASGSNYDVTVASQPVGQTCTVSSASGKVGTMDVTSVNVTCTKNNYTIGGSIFGLTGTVVLLNNNGDPLSRTTNNAFTFGTPLPFGSTYAVTVGTQPANQDCTVSSASGTVGAYNVTTVSVICTVLDAGSGCGATNTVTNCSACGATCDTTNSNTASCNGTTCSYASCKAGRKDCNTSAPNTDGCECASAECCVGGSVGQPGPTATCQPQHNNGVGQSFPDCTPLGTYSAALAFQACTALTNDITKCQSNQCVGAAGGKFGIVCTSGTSTCTCWNYEGTYVGYVRSNSSSTCYCAGSTSYPTWK